MITEENRLIRYSKRNGEVEINVKKMWLDPLRNYVYHKHTRSRLFCWARIREPDYLIGKRQIWHFNYGSVKRNLHSKLVIFGALHPRSLCFVFINLCPIQKKIPCSLYEPSAILSHLPTHIRSLFAGLDKLGIR